MIITRSPVRISFVGGGTDIADFYHLHTGRVISTAIQRYVWVMINQTMDPKIVLKYRRTEVVDFAEQIRHSRVREALVNRNIKAPIEILTVSDVTGKTGLGSSSAFSVALLKALDRNLAGQDLAEAACRLEIHLVGDPIGKQDQYASALGGFNLLEFERGGSVKVQPLEVSPEWQDHLLLFFTGSRREANLVLKEQRQNLRFDPGKLEVLEKMADSALIFKDLLLDQDWHGAAKVLHEGWLRKRSLASCISNPTIDRLYQLGLNSGAWGGKICGAGGGGCLLFIAPPEKHRKIRQELGLQEIPVKFAEKGCEVIFNSEAL